MAIPAELKSEQTLEAQVAGPDATRLFVTTGLATFNLGAYSPAAAGGVPASVQTQQATFSVGVGPQLTVQQFRKAVATASLSGLATAGDNNSWQIADVDADFDDEAGRVRVTVDVLVKAQGSGTTGSTTTVFGVGIQATILAKI